MYSCHYIRLFPIVIGLSEFKIRLEVVIFVITNNHIVFMRASYRKGYCQCLVKHPVQNQTIEIHEQSRHLKKLGVT